jgi:hypothetical protein
MIPGITSLRKLSRPTHRAREFVQIWFTCYEQAEGNLSGALLRSIGGSFHRVLMMVVIDSGTGVVLRRVRGMPFVG